MNQNLLDMMSNYTYLLTIIFGITSGILTLVGLIAIFISISTQHNVQKAREIFWELQGFQAKYSGEEHQEKTWLKLRHLFYHYKQLVNLNRPVASVITIAIISIIFVGSIWLFTCFFIFKPVSTKQGLFLAYAVLGGVGIISFFIKTLINLSRVTYVADLPKYTDLTNIHFIETKKEDEEPLLDMPYLATLSCSLNLFVDNNMHESEFDPSNIDDSEGITDIINTHSSELYLSHDEIPYEGHQIKTSTKIYIYDKTLSIQQREHSRIELGGNVDYPYTNTLQTIIPFPNLLERYRDCTESRKPEPINTIFKVIYTMEIKYKFRSNYAYDQEREYYYYHDQEYEYNFEIVVDYFDLVAGNWSKKIHPCSFRILPNNKEIALGLNIDKELITITNTSEYSKFEVSGWKLAKLNENDIESEFTLPDEFEELDAGQSIHIATSHNYNRNVDYPIWEGLYLGINNNGGTIQLLNKRDVVVDEIQKDSFYLSFSENKENKNKKKFFQRFFND